MPDWLKFLSLCNYKSQPENVFFFSFAEMSLSKPFRIDKAFNKAPSPIPNVDYVEQLK